MTKEIWPTPRSTTIIPRERPRARPVRKGSYKAARPAKVRRRPVMRNVQA
jgi:hypothetical protein